MSTLPSTRCPIYAPSYCTACVNGPTDCCRWVWIWGIYSCVVEEARQGRKGGWQRCLTLLTVSSRAEEKLLCFLKSDKRIGRQTDRIAHSSSTGQGSSRVGNSSRRNDNKPFRLLFAPLLAPLGQDLGLRFHPSGVPPSPPTPSPSLTSIFYDTNQSFFLARDSF